MRKKHANFDSDALYDVIVQKPEENDVITTDMKSTGIHLLNDHSFRATQQFSILDKSTGLISPFVGPSPSNEALCLGELKLRQAWSLHPE